MGKLSKDSDWCVTFYKSHCNSDQNSRRTIGSARMMHGLYYFDDCSFKKNLVLKVWVSSVCSIPIYDQIILWHCRVGHPVFGILKHLFPRLFRNINVCLFQCENCYLSKSHCTTYVAKPYCTSKLFYLVHSNVWGPLKSQL